MTHTQPNRRVPGLHSASVALLLAIGGCTTLPWQMSPDERSPQQPAQSAQALPAASRPVRRASASADKAVSNDYYRVKPGDTLYRIATSHGQRSDDIIAWNNLADASHIETGSVLRVTPPPDAAAGNDTPQARTKPSAKRDGDPASKDTRADSTDKKDDRSADADKPRFGWPARGTLSAVYGQGKSKGMVIAAKAGDTVKAAAPGRVMFAGDGGKPYGKLVIIRHDDALITAYGHNSKLLVKEGTNVKRGDAIAEMAATDHGGGSLQFEVRKDGKAVDPAQYLPRVGS
jgi:lipoprotein NlpD